MIKIIIHKDEWDSFLDTFEKCDLYHTYDYHQIAKSGEEKPILIKYVQEDSTIALPLLIRKIASTPYKDATSVYGYAGPVFNNITESFNNEQYKKELERIFSENNIISVFSRLNPFIPYQEICLKNLGEISTIGNIVNIDLSKDLKQQRKGYQKRLRTHINKSRRNCTVRKAVAKEEVYTFVQLYYENMKRVNAKKNYFFALDYFYALWSSKDFKTDLLLAIHNETQEIIAGAMFIKKGDIVQYHLGGAHGENMDLYPIKLLIDEMRIIATREGYSYFNLGGGVGNKEDNLFVFKSGFSKDLKQFKLWKYIVNETVYKDLVIKKQSSECAKIFKNCSEYFPCYRCDIYK